MPRVAARIQTALAELFRATLDLGGTLSGEHGIGIAKARYMAWEQSRRGHRLAEAPEAAVGSPGTAQPGQDLPAIARAQRGPIGSVSGRRCCPRPSGVRSWSGTGPGWSAASSDSCPPPTLSGSRCTCGNPDPRRPAAGRSGLCTRSQGLRRLSTMIRTSQTSPAAGGTEAHRFHGAEPLLVAVNIDRGGFLPDLFQFFRGLVHGGDRRRPACPPNVITPDACRAWSPPPPGPSPRPRESRPGRSGHPSRSGCDRSWMDWKNSTRTSIASWPARRRFSFFAPPFFPPSAPTNA